MHVATNEPYPMNPLTKACRMVSKAERTYTTCQGLTASRYPSRLPPLPHPPITKVCTMISKAKYIYTTGQGLTASRSPPPPPPPTPQAAGQDTHRQCSCWRRQKRRWAWCRQQDREYTAAPGRTGGRCPLRRARTYRSAAARSRTHSPLDTDRGSTEYVITVLGIIITQLWIRCCFAVLKANSSRSDRKWHSVVAIVTALTTSLEFAHLKEKSVLLLTFTFMARELNALETKSSEIKTS